MQLHYKSFGSGRPLIFLHGLLGMLDNWQSIAKHFADDYSVYLMDLRNHGRSPHHPEMNYPAMAKDVVQTLESEWIFHDATIIGHSMGGKVAMQLANDFPDIVSNLVIVDIAPIGYDNHHQKILDVMSGISPESYSERLMIQQDLTEHLPDPSLVAFLLKNLYRKESGVFAWRANLGALVKNYPRLMEPIHLRENAFQGPTLLIRGQLSDYVKEEHYSIFKEHFPNLTWKTVVGAGHWVHADDPGQMEILLNSFFSHGTKKK